MSMDSDSTEMAGDEAEAVPAHFGNIAFWVADFAGMRKFYSEVLGVPELAAGDGWAYYGYGAFSFSINRADFTPAEKGWALCPMPGSTGDRNYPYMTLYVPDLDAVIGRCRAAGITIRTETPFSLGEGFGYSVEVKDPDGNPIAITQR